MQWLTIDEKLVNLDNLAFISKRAQGEDIGYYAVLNFIGGQCITTDKIYEDVVKLITDHVRDTYISNMR